MAVRIEVVSGDVLKYDADVLALKYAQQALGVDDRVVTLLAKRGVSVGDQLPAIGESLRIDSRGVVAAKDILFVGVEPLGRFEYKTIRRFSSSVLGILRNVGSKVSHVAMTLHGRGFGLDESEAFRAEIAGVLDAVDSGERPTGDLRVSIVERDVDVVVRLKAILDGIVPTGTIDQVGSRARADSPTLGEARAQLASVGHDSREKPHIFVAIPFADEYTDRFHYGIKGAANTAGFLCERADLATFTGDVIAWVKDRIGSAALVVADLTAANPNVYLEVGYAWGRGVNTVLVVPEGDELKFDVRGQKCVIFKSIQHLEELLTAELKSLKMAAGM